MFPVDTCDLGAKMKTSDQNHPHALYRVYYPPYVVPRRIGAVTRKSLACPSTSSNLHYNSIAFQCLRFALSWGAKLKTSDPNHPQALYRVYYSLYVIPISIGGVTRKSLACPYCLFKLAL